ncbi:hypothetical protein BU26DRAFT_61568 [Trematosphaeria pertusa]|uniref:Uncharacterized protein n=1 Tax=Trematosphaeria pertusa TaxID=390896 RepID=A0A6A6I7Y2_9PLEO|nr:uncharacterized protein BU26DRAFT_61568 [Trematosphaeria pertusa]KAF2246072.1 hypothetical protein BU26DRAFT_61568 [Trematosphaeria pertusa]
MAWLRLGRSWCICPLLFFSILSCFAYTQVLFLCMLVSWLNDQFGPADGNGKQRSLVRFGLAWMDLGLCGWR